MVQQKPKRLMSRTAKAAEERRKLAAQELRESEEQESLTKVQLVHNVREEPEVDEQAVVDPPFDPDVRNV